MAAGFKTFREWLTEKHTWFKFDGCDELVKQLGRYAANHKDFERYMPSSWKVDGQEEVYLEKGLFIYGNVGSGKTEIMELLRQYMAFLNSPYEYNSTKVWLFADQFDKVGTNAFNMIIGSNSENWYFDELCLTDASGELVRERAQHYAKKIVVGEEIIRLREESFKTFGLLSHFTSNLNLKDLEKYYGPRAASRLAGMCNLIPYVGIDRRRNNRPIFRRNLNTAPSPEIQTQFEALQQQPDNVQDLRRMFQLKYDTYCVTGETKQIMAVDFTLLQSLGVTGLPTQDELMSFDYEQEYNERRKTIDDKKANSPEEARRIKILRKQYLDGNIDSKERNDIIATVKVRAIIQCFKNLHEKKETKLF